MKKSLRSLFKEGNPVVGTWADGEKATDIEIAGLSGYDFVIIDEEHNCHTNPNKLELIRAAENANIIPIFRVPGFSYEDSIKKVLDMGAGGILVPNISSKEEGMQAIKYSKFAPIGNRGACPFVRANDYGYKYGEIEYYQKANEEVTIIFLIENVSAIENFDEIISINGLDAILIGRADLSVSMGIPGQYENPKLLSEIKKIVEKARKNGVPAGMVAFSVEDTMRWLKDDIDFVTTFIGAGSLIKMNRDIVKAIKS